MGSCCVSDTEGSEGKQSAGTTMATYVHTCISELNWEGCDGGDGHHRASFSPPAVRSVTCIDRYSSV